MNEMYDIHHHHDDTYGSRMTDELKRRGYDVNHKRVELQARTASTQGRPAQKGPHHHPRRHPALPTWSGDFAGRTGKRTCGDITYSAQFSVMCSWRVAAVTMGWTRRGCEPEGDQ